MTALPTPPVSDHRADGIVGFARARLEAAHDLLDTVLAGMGIGGRVVRALLPLLDRGAAWWMARAGDPYLGEARALRDAMGRPGALAFALSYEAGCTTRVFGGAPNRLFRTLDWPFLGLGERVEAVWLPGEAGDWVTATWPGVLGVLHGAAPGRFAIALNQAPMRRWTWIGPLDRAIALARFLRGRGACPPHLLRRVFEQAADFDAARRMLSETPVAVPVIFTLAGPEGQAVTIERTETGAQIADAPAAANHFTELNADTWHGRGEDTLGRRQQILAMDAPPAPGAICPPILNEQTRLAVWLDTDGGLIVQGYDGSGPVTRPASAALAAA